MGENDTLGICPRDATANRLIVDNVDHGIRQQYQRRIGNKPDAPPRCRKDTVDLIESQHKMIRLRSALLEVCLVYTPSFSTSLEENFRIISTFWKAG